MEKKNTKVSDCWYYNNFNEAVTKYIMQSISDSFNESTNITNKYIKFMYVMGWGRII